jgi:hypothetical protein
VRKSARRTLWGVLLVVLVLGALVFANLLFTRRDTLTDFALSAASGVAAFIVTGVSESWGVIVTTFWALLAAALLLSIAWSSDANERRVQIGLGLVGGAAGWLLGILLSPQTAAEQEAFGTYRTALIGVASGFFVAKATPLIDYLLTPANYTTSPALLVRVAFFVAAVLLTTIGAYTARSNAPGHVKIIAPKEIRYNADAYELTPENPFTFAARVNHATNTGVQWTIDPRDPRDTAASISEGVFKYSKPLSKGQSAELDIVAFSLADKRNTDRVRIRVINPPPATETTQQAKAGETGTGTRKR